MKIHELGDDAWSSEYWNWFGPLWNTYYTYNLHALGWDDESCNTPAHPSGVVLCWMTSHIRYDWCWDERFVSTFLETHGGRIIDGAVIGAITILHGGNTVVDNAITRNNGFLSWVRTQKYKKCCPTALSPPHLNLFWDMTGTFHACFGFMNRKIGLIPFLLEFSWINLSKGVSFDKIEECDGGEGRAES